MERKHGTNTAVKVDDDANEVAQSFANSPFFAMLNQQVAQE